jgi:hypothetical protein
MTTTEVRDALAAATVVQSFLVGLTSVLTADNGTLCGPIPIGEASGFSGGNPFGGLRGLLAMLVFVVDVLTGRRSERNDLHAG